MSVSKPPTYALRVDVEDPTLRVSVIDSKDRIVGSMYGKSSIFDLPRGIYTLRSERDGRIADKLVRLARDETATPEPVGRFTPMLLPDASTSHECYTNPTWEVSQTRTAPDVNWNGGANASLLLVLRPLNPDTRLSGNPLEKLRIRTQDGVIAIDPSEDSRYEPSSGFAGWSADMSSGLLILELEGEGSRQALIRLYPGFQTQLYIMVHGRPRLEDLRALTVSFEDLEARHGRAPYDHSGEFSAVYAQVDAGLNALTNNRYDIADSLVTQFLNSKFAHPLLGLIGAYLMLQRVRLHSKAHNPQFKRRVEKVIGNLDNIMPNCADVAALRLLATPYLGEPTLEPIEDAPLFRVGTEALIEYAAYHEDFLPNGSLLDAASEHLLGDGIWTAWSPIKLPPSSNLHNATIGRQSTMSWVEVGVADMIGDSRQRLNTQSMAKQLGVTQRAVRDAYSQLVDTARNAPELMKAEGMKPSLVKRALINRVDPELQAPVNDKLKELSGTTRISYQSAYPALKNLLAAKQEPFEGPTKSKKVKLYAEDKLESVVQGWSKPGVRRKFTHALEQNFILDLGDTLSQEALDKATTVREVAELIVQKSK